MGRLIAALVVAGSLALLPGRAVAADLAGRWHAQVADEPAQIVEISQTGDTVSIPLSVEGLTGGQLTGAVTGPGEFELSGMGYPCPALQPGLGGRLLPDENTADALFVNPCLAGLVWKGLLLTRCTCYDGNSASGDGCDATCQVEPCFTCVGDPAVCTPTADGGSCDDRRDCTAGETCSGGVCGGGSAVVPCIDMTGLWRIRVEPDGFPEFTEETTQRITQRNRIVHMGYIPRLYDYRGAIDTATGAFELGGPTIQFIFGCPFVSPLTGSANPDTFAGTGYFPQERPGGCGAFTAIVTGTRTVCGNGVLEDGEACDDGDGDPGDGCDGGCRVEVCNTCGGEPSQCVPDADGSACSDDDACTTGDICAAGRCQTTLVACGLCEACVPGSGACIGAPLPSCRTPSAPQRSLLRLRNRTPDSADLVSWTWARGHVNHYDLGRPVGGATYTLCVYDESSPAPALLFRAHVPGRTNWRENDRPLTPLYVYANAGGAPDGIIAMILEARGANRSRAIVKGEGPLLSSRHAGLPPLPLPLPLRVQLQSSSGTCFEARYDAAGALENDPVSGTFRARAAR